jgi:hypothetical protein
VLPSWFAEYSLDLGIVGLVVSIGFAAYGWIVASKGRPAGMLTDVSRSRRPTAIAASISIAAGSGLTAVALSTDSHVRLAISAVATALLIGGLSGIAMWPFPRVWTNEYWRMPPPNAVTDHHVRLLGKAYALFGVAFIVACTGVLVGLIPKLTYVGPAAVFGITGIAALVIAGLVAVKGWRLYQSVRVRSGAAASRA